MPYALTIDGRIHIWSDSKESLEDTELRLKIHSDSYKDATFEIKEISDQELIRHIQDRQDYIIQNHIDEHRKTIAKINFAWFVVLVLLLWKC